jgi:hypothetical protein
LEQKLYFNLDKVHSKKKKKEKYKTKKVQNVNISAPHEQKPKE